MVEQYELPDGWVWRELKELVKIGAEQVLPWQKPDQLFNYIALENVEQGTGRLTDFAPTLGVEIKSNKFKFTPDHVLYGKLRPYLRKAVAPDFDGICATDLLPLQPTSGLLDRHFLVWWFLSSLILEYVVGKQTGVKMPRLRTGDLEHMPVPLPPLPEQQLIVARIETLFEQSRATREALDRIPALVKRFRQSVLAAAFRGDLTERDPNDEPASALLERMREHQSAPPDTSGLPELPEGWVWTTIGQVFNVSLGGTPARKNPGYWNGDIPWISSGEVAFCRIRGTRERITAEGLANSNAKLNQPGTVLLAMIGEGKTRGQVAILDISAATNQNIAALQCTDTPIPAEWVFWWLMARYEETRGGGSGGAQPALNAARVRELLIPLAPLPEQRRIVARVQTLVAQADAVEAAVEIARRRLAKVDQAILARAFRGEL